MAAGCRGDGRTTDLAHNLPAAFSREVKSDYAKFLASVAHLIVWVANAADCELRRFLGSHPGIANAGDGQYRYCFLQIRRVLSVRCPFIKSNAIRSPGTNPDS
jgi:hypothetical protein